MPPDRRAMNLPLQAEPALDKDHETQSPRWANAPDLLTPAEVAAQIRRYAAGQEGHESPASGRARARQRPRDAVTALGQRPRPADTRRGRRSAEAVCRRTGGP